MAMSIFNEKQIEAMRSGKYICSKCGRVMEFEDEWEDTLVCSCGHNIGLDEYGCEGDEKYENLYSDENDGWDEDNQEGETYDEVCGELEDD